VPGLRRLWQAVPGSRQMTGAGVVAASQLAMSGPGWPLVSSLPPLGPVETAPGCSRDHTRRVLSDWRLGHLASDAGLLVTELMTNAVNASRRDGTPVCLRLLADGGQLIIEVWDRSPARPELRQAGHWDEDGRGLCVVESLSHRWGWQYADGWKVVWCELLTTARP
jgi:anti-sigma regulatory factor (Ser/Thr protein kinase)